MRTIDEQIRAMKRQWPGFTPYVFTDDSVVWIGSLTAVQRTYNIIVEYGLPREVKPVETWRIFPCVRVLSPRLEPNFTAPEETPLPHVYFYQEDISFSELCLFDPENGEWSHDDLIADTTIFWTSEWLLFYEGWRATGRWYGGGRHRIRTEERIEDELSSTETV